MASDTMDILIPLVLGVLSTYIPLFIIKDSKYNYLILATSTAIVNFGLVAYVMYRSNIVMCCAIMIFLISLAGWICINMLHFMFINQDLSSTKHHWKYMVFTVDLKNI